MCRWITVLSSEQMSLSDIVLTPSNSLIQLSKDASFHPGYTDQNNHVTNGDGFGIGWYHHTRLPSSSTPSSRSVQQQQQQPPDVVINPNQATTSTTSDKYTSTSTEEEGSLVVSNPKHKKKLQRRQLNAAVFRCTQPAWNNANLRELCMAVQSHCIMAHVRAASSFAGISQQNCHPFKAGSRLLFCHNGRIDQFNLVRRKFHALLTDEAFNHVKGTTDSEIIFALLCTYLSEDSDVSPYEQVEPFGYQRLTNALKKVIRTIERILEDAGIYDTGYSTCNFSLTDGETMVVTRFCDKSPNVPPPSLYFAFGDTERLCEELTQEHETTNNTSRRYMSQRSNSISSDDLSTKTGTTDSSFDSSSEYDEKLIDVEHFDSQPGTVYADVDVHSASFIVASCPLTPTHVWHPMPRNSIMWYTRGSLPELRILKRRHNTRSYVFG